MSRQDSQTKRAMTMVEIIAHMEREAEALRVERDIARRMGAGQMADIFGDRAAGFSRAAQLLRESQEGLVAS